jgi:glycosyltransferase involved in cell wall biosynthesis
VTVRISVCIPTWNDAEWLPGAIESVLAQTHQDWELVIGDNCSEQDLKGIVARYEDPRIRYHRWERFTDLRENWNRTAQICQYEWVQPISADDRLEPDCLAKMAQRIEKPSANGSRIALVVTDCSRIDPEGKSVDEIYFGHQRQMIIPEGEYDASQWVDIMSTPGQVPWNMGSIAFSREIMLESGWFRPDIGYGYDMEVVLRASIYGLVIYINEKLFRFTVRDVSDSAGRALRVLQRNDRYTPMEGAWRAALNTHSQMRAVSEAQKARVMEVIARSHVQRALQHRLWQGAGGRKGALTDAWRAVTISPRLMKSPWLMATAGLAVIAPSWAVRFAMKRLASHRRGKTTEGKPWRP